MAFEVPKINYSGKIKEVFRNRRVTVTVGGETAIPFIFLRGPCRTPRIAFEVWDFQPEDWPDGPSSRTKTSLGTPWPGQRNR